MADAGLNCPRCAGETAVIDSRRSNDSIRRRRKCRSCACSFTTEERFVSFDLRGKRKRDRHTIEAERAAENIPTGELP